MQNFVKSHQKKKNKKSYVVKNNEAFGWGFFPFEIKAGFVEGINTIDFVVNNGFTTTCLRVEFAPVNKTIIKS